MEFPDIDTVHEILDEIAESLPIEFYEGLNNGIILLEEFKLHPKSIDGNELYILGQYERNPMGNGIKIFYGSFRRVYPYSDEFSIRKKLKDTLVHEFRHHLEFLSGERDLELEDEEFLKNYKRNIKKTK